LQRDLHYQTINNQLYPWQAWKIPGMFGNSPVYEKTFRKYFAVVLRSSIFVARQVTALQVVGYDSVDQPPGMSKEAYAAFINSQTRNRHCGRGALARVMSAAGGVDKNCGQAENIE
jgi:hypothetical protein